MGIQHHHASEEKIRKLVHHDGPQRRKEDYPTLKLGPRNATTDAYGPYPSTTRVH